jgi:hypothetical protein
MVFSVTSVFSVVNAIDDDFESGSKPGTTTNAARMPAAI